MKRATPDSDDNSSILRNISSDRLSLFNYSYAQATLIGTQKQEKPVIRDTIKIITNASLNALSASPGYQEMVVLAGRDILKIYSTGEDPQEILNLRAGVKSNSNLSSNDVIWGGLLSKHMIITAAAAGAIVVFDINKSATDKIDRVINEHMRVVNRVCLHPTEPATLLSASQDGKMKVWDLRSPGRAKITFDGKAESVRDVQFNPITGYEFASVFENGSLQLWDIRNPVKWSKRYSAHSGFALSVDWNETGTMIATGGRDRVIKVWDKDSDSEVPLHFVQTIEQVSRVKWRPDSNCQIASCSLKNDTRIHIWDFNRPYLAQYCIDENQEVPTGLLWHNPFSLWSCSKDQTFVQHNILNSIKPAEYLNCSVAKWSALGDISFAIPNQEKSKLKSDETSAEKENVSQSLGIYSPDVDETAKVAYLAQNYKYDPENISRSSLHNFKTALDLDLRQEAETWKLIALLFGEKKLEPRNLSKLHIASREVKTSNSIAANLKKDFSFLEVLKEIGPERKSVNKNPFRNKTTKPEAPPKAEFLLNESSSSDSELDTAEVAQFSEINHSQYTPSVQSSFGDPSYSISPLYPKPAPVVQDIHEIIEQLWDPSALVFELIDYYADNGNVQMNTFIIMNLCNAINFDGALFEMYIKSYLDLLFKLKLWPEAAKIIRSSKIEGVRAMNGDSTTIHRSCANCNQPIPITGKHSSKCEKCKQYISKCSLWYRMSNASHKIVKGLFVWCQICAHGGHLKCMDEMEPPRASLPAVVVEKIADIRDRRTSKTAGMPLRRQESMRSSSTTSSNKTLLKSQQFPPGGTVKHDKFINTVEHNVNEMMDSAFGNVLHVFGDDSKTIHSGILSEKYASSELSFPSSDKIFTIDSSYAAKKMALIHAKELLSAAQTNAEGQGFKGGLYKTIRESEDDLEKDNLVLVDLEHAQLERSTSDLSEIIHHTKEILTFHPPTFKAKHNKVLSKIEQPGVLEVDSYNEITTKVKLLSKALQLNPEVKPFFDSINQCRIRSVNFHYKQLPETVLIADPPEVLFTKFSPYQKYTKILTIKNITRYSQRFRMSFNPPDEFSDIFQFKIMKTPQEDDGLIAPGMSARFLITFCPISYANAKQELLVTCPGGRKFEIPIIASMESPKLNLPRTLNCGFCAEGDDFRFTYDICNSGGEARFIIMTPNNTSTPFELFEELGVGNHGKPSVISFGPYQVSPSYFYLNTGDTVTLNIRYTPPNLSFADVQPSISTILQRNDIQKIRIACDNCNIMEFNISATVQQPQLDVVQANMENGDQVVYFDRQTLFDINFKVQNVEVSKVCKVKIANPTDLQINFKWKLKRKEDNDKTKKRQNPDDDPKGCFRITPSTGYFNPNESLDFEIAFTPKFLKYYESSAKLLIPLEDGSKKEQRKGKVGTPQKYVSVADLKFSGEGIGFSAYANTHFVFLPPGFQCGQTFNQKINFTNSSVSDLTYKWSVSGIDERLLQVSISEPRGVIAPTSCITFKMSFTGLLPSVASGQLVCTTANGVGPTVVIPIIGQIGFKPGFLGFGANYVDFGLLWLGEKKTAKVPLINTMRVPLAWKATVSFKNSSSHEPGFIVARPSSGIIQAEETVMVTFTYIPLWYEQLGATVQLHVLPMLQPSKTSDSVDLSNAELVAGIDLIARTETPRLVVLNDHIELSCFIDVSFTWTLTIKNLRNLPTHYRWDNIEKLDYTMQFYPEKGIVEPNKELDIKVKFHFYRVGKFNINLKGHAVGMVEDQGLLKFNISATVVDYTFKYRVLENEEAWSSHAVTNVAKYPDTQSDASLRLDFGISCPIFMVRTRTLIITNHSAKPAPFEINIENYTTTLDAEESEDAAARVSKAERNKKNSAIFVQSNTPTILSETSRPKFGFSSKAGQKYVDNLNQFRSILEKMKRLLSDGRGAAFHAVPNKGILQPWGEVEIKITSYNNLVGIYKDFLRCQVGKTVRRLPVALGVIGIPVKFSGPQLVAKNRNINSSIDLVNFGTRVINSAWGTSDGVRLLTNTDRRSDSVVELSAGLRGNAEILRKKIAVENHSPREIILQWKVYVKYNDNLKIDDKHSEMEDNELSTIINHPNRVKKGEIGVIDVSPPNMTIAPFKSATLQCNFRNCKLGLFDALIMADVAYQEEGEVKYAPTKISKPGEKPKQEPVITDKFGDQQITINDLISVAKLRIKAKCIEPKLSLDVGSRIRIKVINRIIGSDINVDHKTIAFLVNDSDAVCDFSLEAVPKTLFVVQPASSRIISTSGITTLYELKPKEQMMVSVKFIGDVADLKLDFRKETKFDSEDNLTKMPSPRSSGRDRKQSVSSRERKPSVSISARSSVAPPLQLQDKPNSRPQTSARLLTPNFEATSQRIPTGDPKSRKNSAEESKLKVSFSKELGEGTASSKPQTADQAIASDILASGNLQIHFSNGMGQLIPIIVQGVNE
ncbi:WD repeat-containing protein 24 [Terramyces sp. JEL0728]|nr:WD repeat-containing protein 24 [Terramyces sp. JEL0728]